MSIGQQNTLEVVQTQIAFQGIEMFVPEGCELGGTMGHERSGWVLITRDRQPCMRIVWRRHAATPDLDRTLERAGQELQKIGGCGRLAVRTTPDDYQRCGIWDGPDGAWHAAVRWCPTTHVTLAATALIADQDVAEIITTARIAGEADAWHWSMYGVDCELPAWWRLMGVQQYAGLTRAVWQHRPDGGVRTNQVLTMRRFACAHRMLAGHDLETWMRDGLGARERCISGHIADGIMRLEIEMPAALWWRRLRGGRDRRVLHGWVDDEHDRLFVQEWRGVGDPLPCLRRRENFR